MKEISLIKKQKVIKLLFSGLSYDEIAQEAGVAKGSVVNIIDEFKEGTLPIPLTITGYIDELRHVAVDMKNHNITISHLKSYIKLHTKLKEMGVSVEQADEWLDICQDIACSSVSSNQFVKAALELAQVTSGSGLSYTNVVADYNAKLSASKQLEEVTSQFIHYEVKLPEIK